jgi:hypothetical protein
MEKASAPEGLLAVSNEGAAPCGRRDFGLADEIARVERAALDWGVHVDALEGQFVRALLRAIEVTGRTNLAALGDLEALMQETRRASEAERRRIERMIEAGAKALSMANQATENAGRASDRAEQAIDESVARIAEQMSRALLAESQKWLLLKQTERNRREAWRLAGWVAAGAVAIFIGGCATSQWWSGKESAAHQALIDAVDRCWVEPMMVRMADGKTVESCRLADLTPGRPK